MASALARPLGLPAATILGQLEHPSSPEYEVLAQTASQATSQRIMKLGLPGIALGGFPTYSRLYPNGNLAANLVGFTNENTSSGDLTGQAGLEQEYNSLLAGRDGSEEVETGVNGMPIAGTETDLKQPVAARSLRLTIQSSIQYEAEQAVPAAGQADQGPELLDRGHAAGHRAHPGHGPVPDLQPQSADPATTRRTTSRSTNVFAPGSTLKPITVAAALEKGGQTPMSTYTVPDQIVVHGFTFHDAEPHPTARYTVAGILANSLNDGMVQLVQKVTPLQQYDYLRAFGLDSMSGLGLPGESPGLLAKPGSKDYWNDEPYELSFGQGIGVTAIQMASVYATIANGGVRVQPSIVAGTTSAAGKFTPAARRGHPPGDPGQDGPRADDHAAAGAEGRRAAGRAVGRSSTATRWRPRPAPPRWPTPGSASTTPCASTDPATSASRLLRTLSSWSRSTCRTPPRTATTATRWRARSSTTS